MDILDMRFIKGFIRMASDSWNQGWHERNGGNLSYRIPLEYARDCFEYFEFGPWQPIGLEVPGIGGEHFAVTAAGSYFRNMELDPARCFGIIEVDAEGRNYRKCWGFEGNGAPTSELPTHLLGHEVKKLATNGKNRVIHHAHPENVIALTFVLPLDSGAFTRELWQMISECAMVFPEGVGVLDWGVPGSTELAIASAELLRQVNAVVWAHHGLFCAGTSFDEAFGLMHTIEKASSILVKVLAMGGKKQAITDAQLSDMARAYNLKLCGFPEK